MSRQNKVNKTNYVQAGRLTPDEAARERPRGKSTERIKGKGAGRGASRPRNARGE